MLLKKILGILILVLNVAGIGYLLYIGAIFLWNEYFTTKAIIEPPTEPVKRKKPKIANDDIILDEDDLLKDMDLSDLDDLDLDDFE
ncbi:MAG: hypothetical protein L3J69_15090 [Desulfobacula sp.]|nr:hypothetical protein [Desulfobacula sp.]